VLVVPQEEALQNLVDVPPPVPAINLTEKQQLQEALESAASGRTPVLSLDKQPALRSAIEGFINAQHSVNLVTCSQCHERGWPDDKNPPRRGSHIVINEHICKRCDTDFKRDNIYLFGSANDMDPFFHENLEAIEEYKTLMRESPLNEVEEVRDTSFLTHRHFRSVLLYSTNKPSDANSATCTSDEDIPT
jgi:NAD-dependent SIR2 family protein deacetylase